MFKQFHRLEKVYNSAVARNKDMVALVNLVSKMVSGAAGMSNISNFTKFTKFFWK